MLLTTNNISPDAANTICTGTKVLISFFTPDKEVKVDAPVKFIAMNDEIAESMRNQAVITKESCPSLLNRMSDKHRSEPVISPLKANILTGMMGKISGVNKIPEI